MALNEDGPGNDRLLAFSDAIFAFAMTLLMLDIKVPDVPSGVASEELWLWIISQSPKLLIYVLSFFVIGSFWISHHAMFHRIKKHDGALIWLNLAFLLAISLMPFPTAILGEYGGETYAVCAYALFLLVGGALLTLIWWHATSRHRLVNNNLSQKEINLTLKRGVYTCAVLVLSILVAWFVSPVLATYCWPLILVARFAVR